MPKFRDIEKFLQTTCYYQVTIDWDYLKSCLDHYAERTDDGKSTFEMNPDFQRGHVWTVQQQIDYIEFALHGGQSGRDIYWNHPEWHSGGSGPMVLVDGLQRITAVQAFIANKIKAFGYYYNEYDDKLRMSDCRFQFHVNNLKSKADILKWYLQMNTGGVVHTEEEIAKVQKLLDVENYFG